MDKQPTETKTPKQPASKGTKIVTLIIFLGIPIAIGLWVGLSGNSKSSYKGTVDTGSFQVINPATLAVAFHVTNNGSKAGAPYCTLNVGDVNDTYTGTDAFTMKTIQPGQTVTSVDDLTITHQGAQYVTQGTISCN